MYDEGMGRIVRVQMHAEAPSVEECQRALNAGFMTIHGSIIQRLELPDGASVTLSGADYSGVFSRETEFGDEVFESQVRHDSGAIFYRGRRTISFVEPLGPPDALEDATATLVRGTLLSDDDRIRRIQMNPEVGSVDVLRGGNGVWWVTVYLRDETPIDQRTSPPPPPTTVANGQGGTLREALDDAEAQLEITTGNDWSRPTADNGPATAEDVLDCIRRCERVGAVEVSALAHGTWLVRAVFSAGGSAEHEDADLREAALRVWSDCGVEVAEYRTRPRV